MQSVMARTFCSTCLRRLITKPASLANFVLRPQPICENGANIRWLHKTLLRNAELKKPENFRTGSKIKKPDQGPPNPLNWKTFALLLGFGVGWYYYIQHLKGEKVQGMSDFEQKSVGQAAIGGDWELVNQDGKTMTNKDLLGKWVMMYFGFTHCPDICPDELEKLVKVVNIIDDNPKLPNLTPLFITVDPARDSPAAMKSYAEEFSPKIIALTGTQEMIDKVAKTFRVYLSVGPKDEDDDYLVDHTIIMYLIDPEGNFKEYYGKNKDFIAISKSVEVYMETYEYMKKH